MTTSDYLKYVNEQMPLLDPVSTVATATSGLGDALNSIYAQQAQAKVGRNDLANYVTGDSWSDIFNNDNRLSSGLDVINSSKIDYSNVKNNSNLLNAWNSNDLQNNVVAPDAGVNVWGNVLSDAGKGASVGATVGSVVPGVGTLIGGGVGAIAGAVSGIARGFIGSIKNYDNAKKFNQAINRANLEQINNFYDTANTNNKRQYRQNMMNYFAAGGSLEGLNGVTEIGTGSTHEQNPNGGVPIGVAPDNMPNLVEEGELIYNDYVYSNRLKPSKKLLQENNLPEKYSGLTYAKVAKKLQKESEDRPNDPISKTTLEELMSRLASTQETHKAQIEERKMARQFDALPEGEKAALLAQMMQSQGLPQEQPQEVPQEMVQQEQPVEQVPQGPEGQPMLASGGHLYQGGGYTDPVYNYFNPDPITQFVQSIPMIGYSGLPFKIYPYRANPYVGHYRGLTFPTVPTKTTKPNGEKKPGDEKDPRFNASYLRYAPALGAAIGAFQAATQPVDYRYADELRGLASKIQPKAAPTIGGYMRYNPYDVNMGDIINLGIQAAVLRNNRGFNRATQGALNIAAIKANQETNAARNLALQQANNSNREAVNKYNNAIDQTNSNLAYTYDKLNNDLLSARLNLLSNAAKAADDATSAWSTSYNNATTNLYDQLGNIGKDAWNKETQDIYWYTHPAAYRSYLVSGLGYTQKEATAKMKEKGIIKR